ncbi:C6 zinc finger domain protein [Penicillium waksmanii]|uniref:C6 zinc finger domain protein n=1 Tax=Penicillium waksmanii TaxID=69791 RepID=UPI00254689A0|nr:C6 zinc finger domain protein [Penicillium waksmanii]KAJ5995075.1 C6 zinc finger domain protein [Penicillium waksmanii]
MSTSMSDHTGPARYTINSTYWKRNYEISGPSPIYVENSKMTPGKSDLVFHDSTRQGHVMATVKYRHVSADIKIGLNDNNSGAFRWKSLSRVKRGTFRYSFTHELDHGKPETFTWHAKHHLTFTQGGSLELIHDRTGDIAAVFANYSALYPPTSRNESDGQVLEVKLDLGEDFFLIVLVTCLALYEQMRRRNNTAAVSADASVGLAGAGSTI